MKSIQAAKGRKLDGEWGLYVSFPPSSKVFWLVKKQKGFG